MSRHEMMLLALVALLAAGELGVAFYDRAHAQAERTHLVEAAPGELSTPEGQARLVEFIAAHQAAVYFTTLLEGLPVQCTLTLDLERRATAVRC